MKERIKVEHKCDEKSLVVLREVGVLTTYKCLVCGKEFSEIGSIVITDDKDLLMCEIYIKWSEDSSIVSQISKLKKLIPDTKKISNNTLLEAAKKGKSLKVAEMFSAEAYELLEKGKMMGVILQVIECNYDK